MACASCNKPLTACWSTSKTGKKHPYYMCFAKGCPDYRKSIRRDRLEDDFQALLATLQPTEPALTVARAMFTDIWQQRLGQAKALASGAKRQAAKLERQTEQLLDRIIAADSPTVISAYETRITTLEREKLIWTEKAANQGQPKRPFDEMFELAMTFLSNPWQLWKIGNLGLRRATLNLAFTARPAYCRREGFRTPEIFMPFKALKPISAQKYAMAERASAFLFSNVVY